MSSPKNSILVTDTHSGDETSLLDILDHVLNAGVVIRGSIVISLAGVDLVYLGLDVILTSIETALKHLQNDVPKSNS
ncbi:MAG TPA: gas vesicle protein [Terriglobales bacterium]|nr:gas vesicle protein [Terriglobales bacterium]